MPTRRAMPTSVPLILAGLLLAARLAAQPQPTPAPSPTDSSPVRYEPGTPMEHLPIKTCEIQTVSVPRPYTFKLPAKARISLYNVRELKRTATFFEGTIREPMKLDPGYYRIEVEGQKEPIYVGYGTADIWQTYLIYRQPGDVLLGPFVVPGVARLPVGQYTVKGTGFEYSIACRNKERAVFEVPSFETMPPLLEPAPGVAW